MKVKIRKKPFGEIKVKILDGDKKAKYQDKVLRQIKSITSSISDDMDFKLKINLDIE
jgi:hypothetical protein